MSCLVINHVLYGKNKQEIKITHTKPLKIKINQCIIILNESNQNKFANIVLSYQCAKLDISIIRTDLNKYQEILEFVKMLDYHKIKIYIWKDCQLHLIKSLFI